MAETVVAAQLFADLSRSLKAELRMSDHIPHNAESGHAVEVGLRAFLRRTLPERFDALSGFVLATEGKVSDQCDVLLIDKLASSKLLRFGEVGMFPIDGVMARIEVTRDLDGSKAKQDIESLRSFRAMKPLYDMKARCRPFTYLFAIDGVKTPETVVGWLEAQWKDHPNDRVLLPNAVVIPGLVTAFWGRQLPVQGAPEVAPWPDPEDATHVAWLSADEKSDLTLGWWLDLMLAHLQVLLDRRFVAHQDGVAARVLFPGEEAMKPSVEASPPFMPTLLHYFGGDALAGTPINYKKLVR